MTQTCTIEEALDEIREGRMIIVVDDEDRENEGDLVIPSDKITPEAVNFMARFGRGLICMAMENPMVERLGLSLQPSSPGQSRPTAFTVTIDARDGITTGISAADRAKTILDAVNPNATPNDIITPGHIFPLKAKSGGVLERTGHTEASVDLARLAGSSPSGVICEIMKDDGEMARMPDLIEFAQQHKLKITTIEKLVAYRMDHEKLIRSDAEADLPTAIAGDFKVKAYTNIIDGSHHVALIKGELGSDEPVLVRVHSECLTGDAFGSRRCDCREQLHMAMRQIDEAGRGVILYMRQEGRGIGLVNKIKAYALQDQGHDTVEANQALGFPADLRHYGIGAQILLDLGVKKMRLLTNNPKKLVGLDGYGLEVVEQVPINTPPSADNIDYLRTKKEKMGHLLDITQKDSN